MTNACVWVTTTDSDHDVVLQGVEVDGVQGAWRCPQPLHQAAHTPCCGIPMVLDNILRAIGNVLQPNHLRQQDCIEVGKVNGLFPLPAVKTDTLAGKAVIYSMPELTPDIRQQMMDLK